MKNICLVDEEKLRVGFVEKKRFSSGKKSALDHPIFHIRGNGTSGKVKFFAFVPHATAISEGLAGCGR